MIIPGSSTPSLSTSLASELKMEMAEIDITRFPDNECYICIKSKIPREIFIIQTTYPDNHILELFLLQNAAREAGAEYITTIIPYYGYGRQDKKFQEGESLSAWKLAQLIQQDSDKIITIDPHKPTLGAFFKIPTQLVTAVPVIATYFNEKSIDIVLAPDKGALERAEQAASFLGCRYDYLEKKRLSGNEVYMETKELEVDSKNVLIIDDIISTGGTMALGIKNTKDQGAKNVYAACTHGLFIGDAVEKIMSAGCTQLLSTDTIETSYSKISVAPVISDVIKKQ